MKKVLLTLVLLASLISLSEQINEAVIDTISAAMPSAACQAAAYKRPCIYLGKAIANYPDNYPCPCPANDVGAFPGRGLPAAENEDADSFIVETLVSGVGDFSNPTCMSFTDNTEELFVGTKPGFIHKVNLKTGQKVMWLNLSGKVDGTGDKGLLGIETHPDFKNNRIIYVTYTVGPSNNMNYVTYHRVSSFTDNGGPGPENILIGKDSMSGIPSCFNTHIGGAIAFGLDGSLFITSGEGAHWDFNDGDFGQDVTAEDPRCAVLFGADEDVGSMRSQKIESLSGKLLRINPTNGQGICAGSGFATLNPWCTGNANDKASKVYALGLRNPFSMNVRPRAIGEATNLPGVPYIGDVGDGGYEEINAATTRGMNFGWPCWEGPYPMVKHRDTQRNFDPSITRPTVNGLKVNCPVMFSNMTSASPFFYYSRFTKESNGGYFQENAYLGYGFTGNTIAGVGFYTGTSYPPKYQDSVWISEFSQYWIRVMKRDSQDKYTGIQNFLQLDTAVLSIETDPNTGNICYLELNGGRVRCIKFLVQNVAPTLSLSATPNSGVAPLTVKFSMDDTIDRENDPMEFTWNFGDGTATSTDPNPSHTYTTQGIYNATVTAFDKYGNKATQIVTVRVTGNRAPVVAITAPTAVNGFYTYNKGQTITFTATTNDDNPVNIQKRWEVQLIHLNHIHTDQASYNGDSFTVNVDALGADSHASERVNIRIIYTATDSAGLVGSASIILVEKDWETKFGGNGAPVPKLTVSGYPHYQVGQPVRFSAVGSTDPDLDFMFYDWNFGDQNTGIDLFTSHIYGTAGTYTVTLKVTDNWGASKSVTTTVVVAPKTATEPAIFPLGSDMYNSFNVTFSTITKDALVRFTLDGSDPKATSPIWAYDPITYPFNSGVTAQVKAKTFKTGMTESPTALNSYPMKPAPCDRMTIRGNEGLVCLNAMTVLPAAASMPVPNPPAAGNYDVPYANAIALTLTGLNGAYSTSKSNYFGLTMGVDGSLSGQGIRASVSVDYTGDGSWDFTDNFGLFATDGSVGNMELWRGFGTKAPTAALANGSIRLNIWQSIGAVTSPMRVTINAANAASMQTVLDIPYTSTKNLETSKPLPTEYGQTVPPTIPPPTTDDSSSTTQTTSVTTGQATTGQSTGTPTTSSATTGTTTPATSTSVTTSTTSASTSITSSTSVTTSPSTITSNPVTSPTTDGVTSENTDTDVSSTTPSSDTENSNSNPTSGGSVDPTDTVNVDTDPIIDEESRSAAYSNVASFVIVLVALLALTL